MPESYLAWFKNLETQFHRLPQRVQLMSSSVSEPADMLQEDIQYVCSNRQTRYLGQAFPWGHPDLIRAIASRYGVPEDSVILTNGASNAIYLVCSAFLGPGDHAVVESPVYQPLAEVPALLGSDVTFFERKPPAYDIDPDMVFKAVKPQTRLLILTNLHNPSGAMIPDETLLELGRRAGQHGGLKIMIDEIYHDFVAHRQPSAVKTGEVFISISSLSKVYGLSILRCGWILGDRTVIEKIRKVYSLVENIGSRLLESVSAHVFTHLDSYLRRSLEIVGRNRLLIKEIFKPLFDRKIITGSIPDNGCTFFPHLTGFIDPESTIERLFREESVYVIPGRFFNDPACIRIGFGHNPDRFSSDIQEFRSILERIHDESDTG